MIQSQFKALLLENIHVDVQNELRSSGFDVETLPKALGEKELIEKLKGIHFLGIRSRTKITKTILENAPDLLLLACYCIGTNHVDLEAAEKTGVPVFNAPFSNTRSVAELIIAEIIMLSRQLGDRVCEMHQGAWRKTAINCFEVRGKTLGIIGYGHIGSQIGVLAEMLGMNVLYHDVIKKLPIGNVQACTSLSDLLRRSDFVTLHVPETSLTKKMISTEQISLMKQGSYLINASRGSVVDVSATVQALKSTHLAGVALDVFPEEPETNTDNFQSLLQKYPNVILTPHIGGSTQEAHYNIGREILASVVKFKTEGSTTGAVNFPQIEAPLIPGTFRVINVHQNVPGVLKNINKIVSDLNANIHNQVLSTSTHIGYLVMDLDQDVSREVLEAIKNLKTSLKTRAVMGRSYV